MRSLVLALVALLMAAPAAAQSALRGTVELNIDIADCTQTRTYSLVVSEGGTPRLDVHGRVTRGHLRFTLRRPDGSVESSVRADDELDIDVAPERLRRMPGEWLLEVAAEKASGSYSLRFDSR